MEKRRFKYGKMDKRARIITACALVLMLGIVAVIWYYWGEGGYGTAWVVSLFVAVMSLFVLSIPRNVDVTDSAIEIRCVVELTRIPFADLRSVRRLEDGEMHNKIVLLGSYGFFGYFGFFLDIQAWQTLRMYCTERKNQIEITDIYEKRYIISCQEPDKFIRAVMEANEQDVCQETYV